MRFIIVMVALGMAQLHVLGQISTTFNSSEWQLWVDNYSTIDFTGFPDGTPINNHYSGLGVTFTGPTFIFATGGFVNDGWGLHGPNGLHMFFSSPQNWIGIDHGGNAYLKLYAQGRLIGQSAFLPIGGWGSFVGVISTVPFDEVIVTKPPFYGTHILIDDLHWGAPVPAPSALIMFAAAALGAQSRRRRR